MTPFQEIRFWARRAPVAERATATVAAGLVIAVMAWVLVPDGGKSSVSQVSEGLTSPTGTSAPLPGDPAIGPNGATPTPGSSTAPTSPTGPGGSTNLGGSGPSGGGAPGTNGPGAAPAPGTTTPGGTAKTCPAGSGQGITASRIKIAVLLTNIAGPAGNGLFGIASPADQRKYYQAAIDEVNSHGGVACRQLVPSYYNGNPTDQSDLRQKCLDIAQSGAFAVLDSGVYAQFPLIDCYAQHKIAYVGAYLVSDDLRRQYYPYLFDFNVLDNLYYDTVVALRSRGFFGAGNGFKKLGFVYRSCHPKLISGMKSWLQSAGVASSAIVTYDVGCPTALASPTDLQQAVQKFKQAGVTHVTFAEMVGDFGTFTKTAQQQGFKPKYGLADDSLIATSYGSQAPDPNNLDGAVIITASRSGEERTPSAKPTAGTQRCNAAFAKEGLPAVYTLPAAAGNACSNVWMFAAMGNFAPQLTVTQLAEGLHLAQSVDFSYPQGPNDFRGAGVTTGGQYWRPGQWYASCRCWRITNLTFTRSTR